MKRKIMYLLAATVLLGGCNKVETLDFAEGFGKIELANSVDATIATRATEPTANDFKLTVVGDDVNQTWENLNAYKLEDPLFKAGDFTASITWGDPDGEGLDKPYYYGSQAVTVVARKITSATITAKVAKSQAVVRTTAQFDKYFNTASFTLKTASNNTFTFTPSESAAVPVWVKVATKLTVTGTAKRQTGADVTFAEKTLAQTKAATCHAFVFDATNAGSITLTITLDDSTTETHTLDVELNDDAIL